MLYIFSRCKSFALTGRVFLPDAGNSARTAGVSEGSRKGWGRGGALQEFLYTHLHCLAQGGGRGTIGHNVYCTPIIKNLSGFVNVMKLTIARALKR